MPIRPVKLRFPLVLVAGSARLQSQLDDLASREGFPRSPHEIEADLNTLTAAGGVPVTLAKPVPGKTDWSVLVHTRHYMIRLFLTKRGDAYSIASISPLRLREHQQLAEGGYLLLRPARWVVVDSVIEIPWGTETGWDMLTREWGANRYRKEEKRDAPYKALHHAQAEVSAIAPGAEFGFIALVMLFVRFACPADWADWPDGKDAVTNGLLHRLQVELGPGIEAPLRTLRDLPSTLHADLHAVIDGTIEQLGYEGAFHLILKEFTWKREILTPAPVAEILANLVEADLASSIYDPFCRAGELLVAAESLARHGSPEASVRVRGEAPNLQSQVFARINLRLHGIDGEVRQRGSVSIAGRPQVSAIVTNPPFNTNDWASFRDHSWPFGPPPEKNANFAWLQYIVDCLEPGGRAAVLMANNAASSANERERRIRQHMVMDGYVQALISLPPSLFHGTGVGATIWLLRTPGKDRSTERDVVLVDASQAGHMVGRNHRELSDADVEQIVEAVMLPVEQAASGSIRRVMASWAEIQDHDFNLNPAAYLPGVPADEASDFVAMISRWESGHTAAQQSDALTRDAISSLEHTMNLIGFTAPDWATVRLAEVCELIPGAPTKDVPAGSGTVPVLKPKNLGPGQLIGDTDMVNEDEASRNSRYSVRAGDLLCARTGTMGRAALAAEEQQGWVFGSGLICIRVKPGQELDHRFLAAYFMSPTAVDWVIRHSGGTSIPSISVKTLATLPVRLPPLRVQQAIAENIDVLTENAAAHERARQAVLDLRESLLQLLLSGRVPG